MVLLNGCVDLGFIGQFVIFVGNSNGHAHVAVRVVLIRIYAHGSCVNVCYKKSSEARDCIFDTFTNVYTVRNFLRQ